MTTTVFVRLLDHTMPAACTQKTAHPTKSPYVPPTERRLIIGVSLNRKCVCCDSTTLSNIPVVAKVSNSINAAHLLVSKDFI